MKVINNLREYKETPNTISKGKLYLGDICIDGLKEDKNRLVRIYLPSNYDSANNLSVIYMMDGKNLFDKYTSFVGEWGVDEIIEERLKESKQSYIVVGIDSAKTDIGRVCEMLPSNKHLASVDDLPLDLESYGDVLGKFIVEKLKKEVDTLFKTNKDVSYIGGSSMGGLFSFYLGQKYPSIFKGTLAFSPAFCLYQKDYFKEELNKINISNHKLYLLVGDVEYENQFVYLTNYVNDYLSKNKYPYVKYIHDLNGHHNEDFWNKYVEDCLMFFEEN